MSISSVGGASALSQLYSVQQAPADTPADSMSAASAGQTGDSNALTGTSTPNLSSQTLQALLDLTQQDPANDTDPSQASQTGQTGQAQKAHHHGHHHGGMMPAQSAGPAQPSATTAASTNPSQPAEGDTSDDVEASLTSALMNA